MRGLRSFFVFCPLPTFETSFQLREPLPAEDGIAHAAAFLRQVVPEQQHRLTAQQHDGHEVAEGHQRHRDVREAPCQIERRCGPEHHHRPDKQPVERQYAAPRSDETDVRLAVIIVADDRREGEEEDRHGDEDPARGSDLRDKGRLRELNAVERGVGNPAEEDDEGRAGADHERVGEDPEGLDQPLLDGVRDVGRGRDVRRRAHAGLVAEEPPLDALHQRRPDRAARRRAPAEGVREDQLQHLGKPPEVERHDPQREQDVSQRHDRDDHAADARNAVDTAEDDQQRQCRDGGADPEVIQPEGALPGGADRVALHGVEGEAEGYGDQHGEQHAHPALSESVLHVVGRATDEGVLSAAFVELCEGRFDKGARGAQQGDDPHPEDRPGASDDDGRGHACEIARADAARQRHSEGLERRNVPLAAGPRSRRFAQHAEHLPHHPELHAPGTQGEPHGAAEQRRNQDVTPEDVVQAGDPAVECLHTRHVFALPGNALF